MNEQIKDGGPAFPLAFQELDGAGTPRTELYAHNGMTLRDYFAAKAMQAHIAAAWTYPGPSSEKFKEWKASLPPDTSGDFNDWISVMAYSQADSMISVGEVTP